MSELIFIKLGGSLITDKRGRYRARDGVIARLAREIAAARAADPGLRLLVAHGSGSFGHVAARETGYERERGHPTPLAMARVGAAAARLNAIVRDALVAAGVPALAIPPSATARLDGDRVAAMSVAPFKSALSRGLVPLTYGDVALHARGPGGGIASTEALFAWLAPRLRPSRLILLGEVEGVLESPPTPEAPTPALVPRITPATWPRWRAALGGAAGTDVTGGMVDKVQQLLALVETTPTLEARIVDGRRPGRLRRLIADPSFETGTRIDAGHRP